MLFPYRKLLSVICIFLLVAGIISVGIFSRPQPARAGLPVLIFGDVTKILEKVLKIVVAVAYKSGLQHFLNRVAYDTATYVASGGEGQKPAFITKGWGPYLDEVKDEALGVFFLTGVDMAIDEVTMAEKAEACEKYCEQPMKVSSTGNPLCVGKSGVGFMESTANEARYDKCLEDNKENAAKLAEKNKNIAETRGVLKKKLQLCSPLSLDIQMKINLFARNILEPPKPLCTFNQIRKAQKLAFISINGMDISRESFRDLQMKDFPKFSNYYNLQENDFGAGLSIVAEGYGVMEKGAKAGELQRLGGKGFKAIGDLVTGEIKTPDVMREEAVTTAQKEGYKSYLTFTGEAVADAFKVFTNTLVSKFFQRIITKGFNPNAGSKAARFDPTSGVIGSTRGAALQFAEFLKTDFTSHTSVELLVDLTACPSEVIGRGPENCVITENFRSAIERKLSLSEAVKQGYLIGNYTFGFDAQGNQPDINGGLPYRTLVILRKHRIVPVGWELAALYIKKYAKEKVTLGELMAAYDQCGQDGGELSPYCRLLDPNWTFKAPLSECYREGAGEDNLLLHQPPICDTDTNGDGIIKCPPDIFTPAMDRQTVCVDQRTCIIEKPTGCLAYGYCTAERQVWSINGGECPAQFTSCLEVTKQGTEETQSFVLNTTDDMGCTPTASAGCRRYAKVWDADANKWKDSLSSNMNYFLNSAASLAAAQFCKDGRAVGCAEYFRIRHLDTDMRPYTVAEYQTLLPQVIAGGQYSDGTTRTADTLYLNNQARSCKGPAGNPGQYVGCQLYTPRDPGALAADIPAQPIRATIDPVTNVITAWNDECPSSCAGYQRFEQMATNFEAGIPLSPGVTMIPSTAQQCPAQDAGCDEFTNVDEVARGGEGREYYTYLRQCVKPGTGRGEATYYTWQGSDTTGFQLKVWSLVAGAGGAPAVVGAKLDRVDAAQRWDGIDCEGDFNSVSPDLDCREFIDTSLNYYYRYFSMTTEATDNCHEYRRTINQRIYQANPLHSIACAASSAGCREYRGSDGGIVQSLFADTFEGGSYAPWTGTNLAVSSESALRNNYSLRVVSGAQRGGFRVEMQTPYVLKFWAKADVARTVTFVITNSDGVLLSNGLGSASIGAEWQQYTLGSATVSAGGDAQVSMSSNGTVYLDNITLQTANSYVIKDSWKTPAICDQDPPGTRLIGAHVGCAAFDDRSAGQTLYFRRFTNLCPEKFAGCEALINIQNSDYPGAKTYYSGSGASEVTVPADTLAYLIPEEEAKCEANQAGCTVLGLAEKQPASAAGQFATVALTNTVVMVDPDDWSDAVNDSTALCTLPGEYCANWTVTGGGSSNRTFKDPIGFTCEYATKGGQTNWYRKGLSISCPSVSVVATCDSAPYIGCTLSGGECPDGGACVTLGHCIGGRSMSAQVTADNTPYRDLNLCVSNADCADFARPGNPGLCSSYVARCPGEHSSCTEYIDPRLPEACDRALPYGQKRCKLNPATSCLSDDDCRGVGDRCSLTGCDAYYMKKDSLDSTTLGACESVNPELGCVGLHETGGGPDSIYTVRVCTNATTVVCLTERDCPAGGRCE